MSLAGSMESTLIPIWDVSLVQVIVLAGETFPVLWNFVGEGVTRRLRKVRVLSFVDIQLSVQEFIRGREVNFGPMAMIVMGRHTNAPFAL